MDEHKDIRKEFIKFSILICVAREAIVLQICNDLVGLDLDEKWK